MLYSEARVQRRGGLRQGAPVALGQRNVRRPEAAAEEVKSVRGRCRVPVPVEVDRCNECHGGCREIDRSPRSKSHKRPSGGEGRLYNTPRISRQCSAYSLVFGAATRAGCVDNGRAGLFFCGSEESPDCHRPLPVDPRVGTPTKAEKKMLHPQQHFMRKDRRK